MYKLMHFCQQIKIKIYYNKKLTLWLELENQVQTTGRLFAFLSFQPCLNQDRIERWPKKLHLTLIEAVRVYQEPFCKHRKMFLKNTNLYLIKTSNH